ncbi:hypothetical protein CLV60_104419 [Dyadobacter jiangsuensis]|uniref:Uncharacterized protein n=1 Tax=Dyadobacter jiangsuensis TaxID=1591085 RepID=A0A2P8G944_9BACT|nr:hypothetical protein CLV60_104419 [Dyadobacter jiangsuensis]
MGTKKSLRCSRLCIFYIQQGLFTVHPCFFGKQCFFFFLIVGIRHAAIYRTNRSTLRLFMKTNALGTFICNYIVKFVGNRGLLFFATYDGAVTEVYFI